MAGAIDSVRRRASKNDSLWIRITSGVDRGAPWQRTHGQRVTQLARRGRLHAVQQIGDEDGEETVTLLVLGRIQCKRQACGEQSRTKQAASQASSDAHRTACWPLACPRRNRRSPPRCQRRSRPPFLREKRQVQTRMRKQLTEEAQIGEDERLAQRLIFCIAHAGKQCDQRDRDKRGKSRRALSASSTGRQMKTIADDMQSKGERRTAQRRARHRDRFGRSARPAAAAKLSTSVVSTHCAPRVANRTAHPESHRPCRAAMARRRMPKASRPGKAISARPLSVCADMWAAFRPTRGTACRQGRRRSSPS